MGDDLERVACSKCGDVRNVQRGIMTEEGKKKYLCPVCREPVLEIAQEVRQRGDRKLLVD